MKREKPEKVSLSQKLPEEAASMAHPGFDNAPFLAAIVQGSTDAIITKTLEGIITSWNPSAERIFGYTAGEMIGKSILKLIPHDRVSEEPEILRRLQNGEQVEHFETKRIGKFNQVLDISLSISPIRDSHGKIIGASKIARDITEQKAIQKLLRENEERFRMAMESTKLGTWDYDLLSGALSWSAECRNIYQLPEEIEVDFSLFSSLVYDEDRDRVEKAIDEAMVVGGKGTYNLEYRILRYSDKAVRWIRAQGKVYFTQDKQPERFIGTVLDITDEKAAKDLLVQMVADRTSELVKINEQLEKSNNELEQFAYIASHDLQEPLRKIQTYSNLLQQHFGNREAADKYFDKISTAASSMSRLIRDVLNYSRLNDEDTPPSHIDLNNLIKDVLSDLEVLIEEKKVEIHTAPLPVIKGSFPQMHQLFSNLIGNAIKFSEAPPKIHISCNIVPAREMQRVDKPLANAERYVEIKVADNGIGFDQQYANQIFVIFQRLHTRQKYSGTGIGLALCHKIVSNHGGIISAEGRPGKGATFTVILPFD